MGNIYILSPSTGKVNGKKCVNTKEPSACTFGSAIMSASIMMFLTTSNEHMWVAKVLADITNHVSA